TGVATIIGSNIHIVGAGTANITASQVGNEGYFPATDVSRTLTVNKTALAIKVRDTTKLQGQPNPTFTITYTGFVAGDNAGSLTTQPTVNTTATTASLPGYYPLTPQAAVTGNYNFTYTAGRLTILPNNADTTQQHIYAYMSSSTTLTVRVFSPYPTLSDIVLFDLSGKALVRKNIFVPAGFISNDVDVSLLTSGIYIVAVRGNGVNLRKTVSIIK
ncbi:MAG: MBG domain-containing protein, partial [Chitinophagaceae bacterium]